MTRRQFIALLGGMSLAASAQQTGSRRMLPA
jgi:hypothetical protein